jgi:hypothetical protein
MAESGTAPSEMSLEMEAQSKPTGAAAPARAAPHSQEKIIFMKGLGRGILKDVRNRLPLYGDDWRAGLTAGAGILAPATYIFFASVLPALAFGEQFREETEGLFSIPHILCATAMAGVLQSVLGGQPLLIVGVAEPIVLVYYYIFKYCDGWARHAFPATASARISFNRP